MATNTDPPAVFKTKVDECPEESFAVDKILDHKLIGGSLLYDTSWVGYPASENSEEPETSFVAYLPVYKYWSEVRASSDRNTRGKSLAFGGMYQHEVQTDKFRFHPINSLQYKNLVSETVGQKYGWMITYTPDNNNNNATTTSEFFHRYSRKIQGLTRICEFYPDIEVVNDRDNAVPLAMENFLVISVTKEMKLFPPGDPNRFNEPIASDDAHDAASLNLMYLNDFPNYSGPECAIVCWKNFVQLRFSPAYFHNPHQIPLRCHLQVRRHPESFWEIVPMKDIEKGVAISPICGEIVDDIEAQKCLVEEGPMIAFTHFIRLPGEDGKCLDRRSRSDFTRYVHHSCDPNCEIKAVILTNRKDPNATVIALYLVAAEDIPRGTVLTVNFFKRLPRLAKFKERQKVGWGMRCDLSDKGHDTMYCTCDAHVDVCRGVLWISKKNRKAQYKGVEVVTEEHSVIV